MVQADTNHHQGESVKKIAGWLLGIAIVYIGFTYVQARDPQYFAEGYQDCSGPACVGILLRSMQADESYTTVISDNDKVNSKGKPLGSLTGYLIQDRANYHRFGKADSEDNGDTLFTTTAARSGMASMIDAGYFDPHLEDKARQGTVGVTVFVFGDTLVATENSSYEASKKEKMIQEAVIASIKEGPEQQPSQASPEQEAKPTAPGHGLTLIATPSRDFLFRHSYAGEIIGVSRDHRKVIKVFPGKGHAVLYEEKREHYNINQVVLLADGSALASIEIAGCSTCHSLLKLDGTEQTWIYEGPSPNQQGVFARNRAQNQSIQRLSPSGDGSALIKYVRHASPNSHQSKPSHHIDLIHHSGEIIKLFENRSLDLGLNGDILVSINGRRPHSHWVIQGKKAVRFYDDRMGTQLYRAEFKAGSVLYTDNDGDLVYFDGSRNHNLGSAKGFREAALDPTGKTVALARTITSDTPGRDCYRYCYLIERFSNGQSQVLAQEDDSMVGFVIANGNIYYSMNRGITGYKGSQKEYFKGYPATPAIPLKNGQVILERNRGIYPKIVGF